MKFQNLMYNGKEIKVIVDLDDCFIENNNDDIADEDSDTLDLAKITEDIEELEV